MPKIRKRVRTIRHRSNAYDKDVVRLILRRIRRGEVLGDICRSKRMPTVDTVLKWISNDYRGFEKKYYRAKAVAMELHDGQLLDIADESGYTPGENAKARLQTDVRKWRMERNARGRYGGSSHVTLAGDPNAPIRIAHPKKRMRYRLEVLRKRIAETQALIDSMKKET